MDVKALARAVRTLTAPIENRVLLMIGRGVLHALGDAEGDHLRVKHGAFADETLEDREVFHDYGFTAKPHQGAEVLFACLSGNRSRSVVIRIADRRYRLADLKDGEVAIFDDQGQTVHLTRDGIVIKGAGQPVIITDAPKVRAETPLLECTGDIKDRCDSPDGRSLREMRSTFKDHVHPENDNGGPTDPPTEAM